MTDRTAPTRTLGLPAAAAVVGASMVGAGVFTTSGLLLESLGSRRLVLLAWLLGGLLATLGALCYGALGRRLPESGGEYLFLSRLLHPAAGAMAGWVSVLVGFSAPLALAAWGFGAYVRPWTPGLDEPVLGSLLVLAAGLLHGGRVRTGAGLQTAVVAVKLGLLFGAALLALPFLPDHPDPPAASPLAGPFALALLWVSFSYSGYNAAVYVAGELRDPERNLPRALLLGCLAVVALYLLLNAVFLYAAPPAELAGRLEIGRVAAAAIGGPRWGDAVAAFAALAQATSVSAMVFLGPRVVARMAADGVLPRLLAAQRPGRAPGPALVLQLALALVFLWTSTFGALLSVVGFTLSLSTAAAVLALVRLRLAEGPTLRIPGWPWVPLLFLLATLGSVALSVGERPLESLWGLAVLGFGYASWRLAGSPRPPQPPPPTPPAARTTDSA